MTADSHEKVNAGHLKRNAYLYIRQSTLRQVLENTESTIRQYDLRQRAVALGWPTERIMVIDSDLGQSAATAADREGFQKLVTDVSLEKAGIVLGLEVSRLARNSTDWHRVGPKYSTELREAGVNGSLKALRRQVFYDGASTCATPSIAPDFWPL